MATAAERDPAELAGDPYEDTVELELSPQDVLALSRGAEGAHLETGLPDAAFTSQVPASLLGRQTVQALRFYGELISFVGGVLLTAAVVGVWGLAHRPQPEHSPAPTATSDLREAAGPEPTAPVDPPGPAVRLTNPFDSSDVFEFPPGTSETEAREAVAEALIQRARERRSSVLSAAHGDLNHLAED